MLGHNALGRFALGQTTVAVAGAYTLQADAGAYTLTGMASGRGLEMAMGTGAYALTGQAASRRVTMAIGAGAYTLTGVAARLAATRVLMTSTTPATDVLHVLFAPLGGVALGQGQRTLDIVATTTYVLSGKAVDFRLGKTLIMAPGAYALTGRDIEFQVAINPPRIIAFPRVGKGIRGFGQGGGMSGRSRGVGTIKTSITGG